MLAGLGFTKGFAQPSAAQNSEAEIGKFELLEKGTKP
jgi:hypothetical protein